MSIMDPYHTDIYIKKNFFYPLFTQKENYLEDILEK